jgi:hypothetical protein
MIDYRLSSATYTKYWSAITKYASQWIGKVTADCMGVYEMFYHGGEWDKPLTYFRYPDTNTGLMYSLAKSEGLKNGLISTLPKNCPYPIAVGFTGHVGFYYKGMVYQSSGHAYGLEKTELTNTSHQSSSWKYWYYLPYLDYTESVDIMLEKGDTGLTVTYWQKALMKWNPLALPKFGADSDFGDETHLWTNNFKASVGLPQDGFVDDITYGHMMNALMSMTSGVSQAAYDLEKAKADNALAQVTKLTGDLSNVNHLLEVSTLALQTEQIKVAGLQDDIQEYEQAKAAIKWLIS